MVCVSRFAFLARISGRLSMAASSSLPPDMPIEEGIGEVMLPASLSPLPLPLLLPLDLILASRRVMSASSTSFPSTASGKGRPA